MQKNTREALPFFQLPAGYDNHDNYLQYLVGKGAAIRYQPITPAVSGRIRLELDAILRFGYAKYYLIVYDILEVARQMDVRVGPGRGNAAGSIVAYCLGITVMDPLKYGLLFERVLHPDANSFPDIDSDVDLEGRPKLIDYVNAQYSGQVLVTQYGDAYPEEEGVLQIDIIGKEHLSILKRAVDLVRKNRQYNFNIDTIPLDDKKTFRLLQSGNTTGIPFFYEMAMQVYLRKLHPVSYEQLAALYALYHSGTHKFIDAYIQKKNSAEPHDYELPVLEEMLRETSGEFIYQEQLMVLCQHISGFSKEDSDRCRRAMQKEKNINLRPAFESKFMEGGKSNGYNEAFLFKIWSAWATKGEWLFNKSHAVSFVLIAWQTAYIKSHYQPEFSLANVM